MIALPARLRARRSTRTTPGRSIGSTIGQPPRARSSRPRPRRADLPLRPPRHRPADRPRSSRSSRTASCGTRAGTILGADDKSAVAAMLEATRRLVAENRPHAGLELLFTPKEEVGLVGAYAFDHTRLRARIGYVYDQAAPIGEVVLGAPSSRSHRGDLPRPRGACRHVPRGGPLGDRRRGARDRGHAPRPDRRGDDRERRRDHGRHRARTSFPECCSFRAEARSHDEEKLADLVARDDGDDGASPPRSRSARSRRR